MDNRLWSQGGHVGAASAVQVIRVRGESPAHTSVFAHHGKLGFQSCYQRSRSFEATDIPTPFAKGLPFVSDEAFPTGDVWLAFLQAWRRYSRLRSRGTGIAIGTTRGLEHRTGFVHIHIRHLRAAYVRDSPYVGHIHPVHTHARLFTRHTHFPPPLPTHTYHNIHTHTAT